MDGEGDDRTFKVNFSGEGATRLKEVVMEKLKEFMGDYTDDILVEYVIVLLRNGRRRDEAGKELNVFLGDDSMSFADWLWDHLSSNLHLYVQSPVDGSKKPKPEKHSRKCNSPSDSDYDREKTSGSFKSRHNREWKGLVRDETKPLLFQTAMVDSLQSVDKPINRDRTEKRSLSPRSCSHKKRNRQEEQATVKREVVSRPMLNATSRLLQFAVRDAVRTVQQSNSRTVPEFKRLRSVVATSTLESHPDVLPQKKPRPSMRAPGLVSAAIKAAAEAAEDVVKVKGSVNVFDRLGIGAETSEIDNPLSEIRSNVLECRDDEYSVQIPMDSDVQQRECYSDLHGDVALVHRDADMVSYSGSDYDVCTFGKPRKKTSDLTKSASSLPKDKESLTVHYSVSQDANLVRKAAVNDQKPPVAAAANASSKIVNISVNVNTWKPLHHQLSREMTEVENQLALEKCKTETVKRQAQLHNDNNTAVEAVHVDGTQKNFQKPVSTHGSYPSGRPSEDADSRTIFVSNVHFAATKDALSRHFNKFGEVLKVIIVSDAASGQPKGSAYVEFLRKESAESALSLNGTSFMSRILKVVRRSAAIHEASTLMPWPRIARAPAFSPRLGRTPYPRGIMSSAFRGRLPIKPGARSLQWKREIPGCPADNTKSLQSTLAPGHHVASPTGKNLTYIRSEPKPDTNSSLA